MVDITMCDGKKCPLRDTCYRYKAIADYHSQVYFQVPPNEWSDCEYYIQLEEAG